jgi:8-oxo-dGTP pyrophosphatase MutT (NUDIX family)
MYKGAGILFTKRVDSKQLISLGKRTIRPHEGYWSVPGGGLDIRKDGNDFFKCALRETREEYFNHSIDEFGKISHLKAVKKCEINIPFIFEFHTFLIDISEIQVDFSPNWEFEKIAWFDVKQLPDKTHLGVSYAIWNFGL